MDLQVLALGAGNGENVVTAEVVPSHSHPLAAVPVSIYGEDGMKPRAHDGVWEREPLMLSMGEAEVFSFRGKTLEFLSYSKTKQSPGYCPSNWQLPDKPPISKGFPAAFPPPSFSTGKAAPEMPRHASLDSKRSPVSALLNE